LRNLARISAILVMLAGLSAAGAGSGLAAKRSAASSAVVNQIVALDGAGHVVVYGLKGNAVVLLWQSPSGGWTNFATGDFNGSGVDQVVAMNSTTLQIFSPVPGPAIPSATLAVPSGDAYHLLAAGDFHGYGHDQIVFTYTNQGSGTQFQEWTSEWDPMSNALHANFDTQSYPWQSIVVGKLDTDDADVVLMRNQTVDGAQDNYIVVYGWNWGGYGYAVDGAWDLLFHNGDPENGNSDTGYCCNWTSGVIGPVWTNPSPPAAGLPNASNMLVLARDFVASSFYTELLWWAPGWIGNTSSHAQAANNDDDLTPTLDPNHDVYVHAPSLARLALANLNGDPDGLEEVLGLRQFQGTPPYPTDPFLVTLNPNEEAGVSSFAPYLDPADYSDQWYQLAAGDLNGDEKDEVVVERGDDLRVYYQPTVDTSHADFPGNGYLISALQVANLGLVGDAILDVAPTTLNYSFGCGQVSASQAVAISNELDTGAVAWQAQASASWIVLDKASGSTNAQLNVTVDPTKGGTQAGSNTATIRISANSSQVLDPSQTVTVTYNQIAPALAVSPASGLNLAASWDQPASGSLSLSNSASSAPLAWIAQVQAGSGQKWLDVAPAAGTTPASLTAFADPDSAGVGTGHGDIHITALDACNASLAQDVNVTVDVADPVLVAEPTSLSLWQVRNGAAPSRELSVLSPGGETLQWQATAVPVSETARSLAALRHGAARITDRGLQVGAQVTSAPSWLVFSPSSGVSSAQGEQIQVTVDSGVATSLGIGTYSAVILVVPSNPFDPALVRSIPVNLRVVAHLYQDEMPFVAH